MRVTQHRRLWSPSLFCHCGVRTNDNLQQDCDDAAARAGGRLAPIRPRRSYPGLASWWRPAAAALPPRPKAAPTFNRESSARELPGRKCPCVLLHLILSRCRSADHRRHKHAIRSAGRSRPSRQYRVGTPFCGRGLGRGGAAVPRAAPVEDKGYRPRRGKRGVLLSDTRAS
jgi:hypothetical protein